MATKKSDSLLTRDDALDLVPIEDLLREAQETALHAIPANTLRSYRADWRSLDRWCERRKLSSLPADPNSVCAYLVAQARTLKISTLRRRLTVIGKVHRIRGATNPTDDERVRRTWRGLLRTKGEAQSRKSPLLIDEEKMPGRSLPVRSFQGQSAPGDDAMHMIMIHQHLSPRMQHRGDAQLRLELVAAKRQQRLRG
jgi:hypothetical protein